MILSRRALLSAAPAAALAAAPALAAPSPGFGLDAAALGLKPGGEDQSALLKRLIDRAAREQRPLFLPPGRYTVGEVELPSGARLVGVPGATRLVAATARRPILVGRGIASAAIEGVGFEGVPGVPDRDTALVSFAGIAALEIADCRFAGAAGKALALSGCGGRISRCTFSRIGDVAIFALDGKGFAIQDNSIDGCGNNGIQVWRSAKGEDGTIVSGNRISNIRAVAGGSGQNGNAINVFRAAGVIVQGNVVRSVAFTAVRGNAASNVQILGNSIADCGEVAIYSEFDFEGAVIAGNLVERAATGISITNFDHGGRLAVCQGNIIRKLKYGMLPQQEMGGGIGIHAEAETAVTGNTIEEAETAGISLGWGEALRNVAATGNLVRGAGRGITVSAAPGAGQALVANNLIAGARHGAIVAMAWTKPVSGDLLADSAQRFPHITLAGNKAA